MPHDRDPDELWEEHEARRRATPAEREDAKLGARRKSQFEELGDAELAEMIAGHLRVPRHMTRAQRRWVGEAVAELDRRINRS